jgi:cytochrome c
MGLPMRTTARSCDIRPVLAVMGMLGGVPAAPLPTLAQEVLRGHGGPVRAMAVRPDARELISGSFDSTVIVWDLERSAARRVLRFHDGPVNAVAALDGGCIASGGEDRRIAIWCGEGDRPARVLEGHTGPINALASSGPHLASASFDGTVRLWEAAGEGASSLALGHRTGITALAAIRNQHGQTAATADGALLMTKGGTPLQVQLTAPVSVLGVAADGEIVAASADGHIRLFAPTLHLSAEIEIERAPLASLALSPDGKLIATAGLRGGIAIVERASRRVAHRLTGPGLPVWSLAFDNDSRTLISGGADRLIRRWDAVTGKPLTSTLPDRDPVAEAVKSGERGAQVFRACQACHTLTPDGGNRAGPTLAGIMGRRIGTAPGYVYSDALPRMDIVWTRETIARLFEIGPNAFTPGTKMPEQTITNPADRMALVEWLERVTR